MIQAFLQRLARWLDRPLFPWRRLVVGFSLAEFALENWLLFRQYRVLQRTTVPKALDKEIERTTFDKSQVCGSLPSGTFYQLTHAGIRPRKG
jgi:STE24 endopeptidase